MARTAAGRNGGYNSNALSPKSSLVSAPAQTRSGFLRGKRMQNGTAFPRPVPIPSYPRKNSRCRPMKIAKGSPLGNVFDDEHNPIERLRKAG